jgi:hypothetical protein
MTAMIARGADAKGNALEATFVPEALDTSAATEETELERYFYQALDWSQRP